MFGFISDVAKIVMAPVVIAAEVARVVTKPVAEEVEKLVKSAKDLTE